MTGEKVQVFEAGEPPTWSKFQFEMPGLPTKAKCFLKDRMGMAGMEVSLNSMRPGEAMPFVHRHQKNEELYVFVSGKGEFLADGELLPIRSGTCIYCEPSIHRSWRNNGTQDLLFIVIQTRHRRMSTSQVFDGEVVDEGFSWSD